MAKLHRISAADAEALRLTLWMAALTSEPFEGTQRKEFRRLMPDLYLIKEVGRCTFKQLTLLLKGIGLRLSEPTVRAYYSEFLDVMKNESKSEIEELIALTEEIKKETVGLGYIEMLEKARAIMKRKGWA